MSKVLLNLSIFLLFFLPLFGTEPIIPIPEKIEYNRSKALLGKRLFVDPNLSKDKSVACVNCHNFESGADTLDKSIGVNGARGNMNSPTVFNSVYNFRQMWNGAVKTLEEQVFLPLHNPKEMGMEDEKLLKYLRSQAIYQKLFHKIYKRKPNLKDMADAIAEFEKALITPNSPFDRYLKKEHNLSPKEEAGYLLFKKFGCITCHNGINIGGNSYQKFGSIRSFKRCEGVSDLYAITSNPADKNVFKVPTLRNIALSAPYFHHGKTKTLKEAIKIMAVHNLGFKLKEEEIEKIEAFLKTLTGQKPLILKEGL
jgi:cytochrome c peroxidase